MVRKGRKIRMSMGSDTVTRVSLKSCPDYLPRVRRIVACLPDSVGMDDQESNETALVLTEACVNAMRHGSPRGADDNVSIILRATSHAIIADVTDSGGSSVRPEEVNRNEDGLGVRLMRMLSDSVQFLKHKTGLTVRLTKSARASRGTRPLVVGGEMSPGRN